MRTIQTALLISLLLISSAAGADAEAWRTRTIYQLVTDRFWRGDDDTRECQDLYKFCGGNFDGITKQLSYIKDLGFDAIWISPVIDNIESGYHGYYFRNWEKINHHFGDEAALKRLVDAAHAMGMFVMVDVLANHVAPIGYDYSRINPFNEEYHYHKPCEVTDWKNQWQLENCRLFGLPDLDQNMPWVRKYLLNWVKNLVQKYNFDGIRIDTVRHIDKDFWAEYSKASGVFSIGEAFSGEDEYIAQYQQVMDSAMNFGMYFTINEVFAKGHSMRELPKRLNSMDKSYKNPDLLGLFADNHDQFRFLEDNPDWRLFKSALTFVLTARGIPIVYYGSEQGFAGGTDPANRQPLWTHMNRNHELYKYIQVLNRARIAQGTTAQTFVEKWVDDNIYAYTRGKFFVALTNQVAGQYRADVPDTGFSEGELLCNIFHPTDCVKIQNGTLPLYLNDGEAKVFIPKDSAFFVSLKKSVQEILTERMLSALSSDSTFN